MGTKVDRIVRKILNLLQEDCTMSVSDISAKVALSSTPCWRRIQRMEKEGIISKRVALLNPKKINADVTAFVAVKTNEHNNQWLSEFKKINLVIRSPIKIKDEKIKLDEIRGKNASFGPQEMASN